jgi:fatty acid-binding protein DegV
VSGGSQNSTTTTPLEVDPFTKAQVAKIGMLLKLDATSSRLAAQTIERAIANMQAGHRLRAIVNVDTDLAWLKRAPDRVNGAIATLGELLDAKGPSLPIFMAAHKLGASLAVSRVREAQETLALLRGLTQTLCEHPEAYRMFAYADASPEGTRHLPCAFPLAHVVSPLATIKAAMGRNQRAAAVPIS